MRTVPDETPTEQDLFQGARGDVQALARLYDELADDLYRLALWRTGSHADACDVVHDVFVRLLEKGVPNRVRKPRAYLLRIAHNLAVDRERRRRGRASLDGRLLEAPTADPADLADARRVSRILLELPSAQREVLYLRLFRGLSFREIGRITGVSLFTAASRYRLAVRRLRIRMGVKP